jgi:hypothetical protein
VGEVRVVADMHERKAEMARQSEAFIALPGARPLVINFLLPLSITLILIQYRIRLIAFSFQVGMEQWRSC